MTNLFNNCKLPLNRIQKLQTKAAYKVSPIKHDKEYDSSMITAYLNGNEEAGLQLLESYIDIVGYIYKNPQRAQFKEKSAKLKLDWTYQDREDLMQEICLHFFTLVHEYDFERPFEGLVKGKLHLRVFNNFFEEFAETKLQEMSDEEIEDKSSLVFSEDLQSILLDENQVSKLPSEHLALYNAMNQLSPSQRQIIEMSVVKGWNSIVIAEELDMKDAAVRKALSRGMKRLKEIMNPEEELV
jgi:RNA polymerase sigma factor (sigma-70 family)